MEKKFRKQIDDYFKQLFNNSHESLKLLTSDYLSELVEKQIVRDEKKWLRNNKYEEIVDGIGSLPKRKNKRPDNIGINLGNLTEKVKKKITRINNPKSLSHISDEYLRTWNFYFEELKKFKAANNGNTIVPRNYADNRLYNWYRKQKYLYNHFDENNIRLIPKKHEDTLNSISFFWQDGHISREIRIWETRLKECVDYCKSKNLDYVWVTWEKKDPLFPFKTQASWCIRQRRRIIGEDKKPISDYEKERLRDVKFLFESENEGGKLKEDDFIARLIELSEFKTDCINKGGKKWLPSQTDPDPKTAELGNWLNDKIEWIKSHSKNDTQSDVCKEREKEFLELGIYVDGGIRQSYFEYNAKEYIEMRKKYPLDNPIGKERKPYADILKWATENKSRFDTFPDWRQKRLREIGIGE
ncbi:MAG: helicase associated domain-containing protein [Bacteroidota bacterium]